MTGYMISIAGYDPSGGAGVLLDLGVFERLGHRGLGVLTAVTVQDPERVDRVSPVSARAVAGQFERLAGAVAVAGIKVGMIATAENLSAVARILGQHPRLPRIVDPVLRSSSGALLLEKAAWPRYLAALRGKASLITPNLDEAEILSGRPVRSVAGMRSAAALIAGAGRMPCLIKGGHLRGLAADLLYDGREFTVFQHERLPKSVHGTGCYLASAILVYMAEGRPLKDACRRGIARVGKAIGRAVPAKGGRWVFDLSQERRRTPPKGRERR